ncbi:shieldin complex subunit 1 isoform X2 [Chiroxiphia lanceolata]|uniref:shieldin complex subunit 1 isoform X2 n=1 Tax=Chiroxiphia lanceolata TaxID=296741 RepID=UPI0013CF182A|nr:shieldin complex subunit 1 isoform X2 [Chiroxiphia lanceolata]XP_032537812.1 shieldin complex subunit 1 isoform X2 [Chiroxiphia lanceolata]
MLLTSGTMEGTEMSPSVNSEESSVLDLPSVCDLAELFVPPRSAENTEELYRSVDAFPSLPTGESNLSSAVPAGFSAEGSEKANVRCYPKAGLCEPTEPDDAALSWMYKRDSAEDPSIRKSLDDFYNMYCKKQPGRMDPTYEAASQCLSRKISELANRDGTKYASRCLQMAQLVLNRDGCKIFPNHPPSACFSKPAEGGVLLEDRKRTPGLSDDILQLLLKQTQAEHSPDVSHEK